MLFTQRKSHGFRFALSVFAAYVLLVAVVAMLFPQARMSFVSSFGWWLAAIPVGLVTYAAFEFLSTKVLELPFWKHMPSWMRILLLVMLICTAVFCVVFIGLPIGSEHAY